MQLDNALQAHATTPGIAAATPAQGSVPHRAQRAHATPLSSVDSSLRHQQQSAPVNGLAVLSSLPPVQQQAHQQRALWSSQLQDQAHVQCQQAAQQEPAMPAVQGPKQPPQVLAAAAPTPVETPPASTLAPTAQQQQAHPPPKRNAMQALMHARRDLTLNPHQHHGPPPDLAAPPTPPEAMQSLPPEPLPCMRVQPHTVLEGEYLLYDFVSPEEEAMLVHMCDHATPGAWSDSSFSGKSRNRYWGVESDYAHNVVRPAKVQMPGLLLALAERMRRAHQVMAHFHPNESNAIEYVAQRNDWLRPHADNRIISTELICTLSLLGRATMTFTPDARLVTSGKYTGPSEVRVDLPRRVLQVLTRSARYDFLHQIKREDLCLDPRRVSISFRTSYNGISKDRKAAR